MKRRILVISDVHGQVKMFRELLQKVNYNPLLDKLIVNGDLIDRGSFSKEVIDLAIELSKNQNVHFNMGNHEELFLSVLEDVEEAYSWIRNGGYNTLTSYCPRNILQTNSIKFMIEYIKENYQHHIDFIQNNMKLYYEDEQIVVAHAGLNPVLVNFKNSTEKDFLRNRDFITQKVESTNGRTVIFGHTMTYLLHGDEENSNPFFVPQKDSNLYEKIAIDGGAGAEKQLNCLIIENDKFDFDFVTYKEVHYSRFLD